MKIIRQQDNDTHRFRVIVPRSERDEIANDPLLVAIYRDLETQSRRESDGSLSVASKTRYEGVLRLVAYFCDQSRGYVRPGQFATLVALLLVSDEKVRFTGAKAHRMMLDLYALTPGGSKVEPERYPTLTPEEEPYLRIRKETVTDPSGAPKTTIILGVLGESELMRRLIGAQGTNIKALGGLFVPHTGVHVYVEKNAPPADLDALLGVGQETEPSQVAEQPVQTEVALGSEPPSPSGPEADKAEGPAADNAATKARRPSRRKKAAAEESLATAEELTALAQHFHGRSCNGHHTRA